jgi:ArsR family transcriptional regulator, arsenate/arsenite/antimonite-responsive transcriptional repressor
MSITSAKRSIYPVAKYADMFSAMGTEARLRIMQLLLKAHPEGLVVGEIQEELEIPNSTLSHHLDKLKNEDLVNVRRESTFLRYTANTEALQELLQFLYAECCTRNKALKPQAIVQICKLGDTDEYQRHKGDRQRKIWQGRAPRTNWRKFLL